ncbi:Integrase [Methylorubrum populi]
MEALLAATMTATTAAYVQTWHGLLAWARAVDTMMGGSRG